MATLLCNCSLQDTFQKDRIYLLSQAKKGLDLDLWAESIKDGHHPDFFTLFALNALLETHAVVHIGSNKIWTTMNNPPGDHDLLIERCEYHLVFLGRGNFIELVERQRLLIIINNSQVQ